MVYKGPSMSIACKFFNGCNIFTPGATASKGIQDARVKESLGWRPKEVLEI
jgi:hypothetical protein